MPIIFGMMKSSLLVSFLVGHAPSQTAISLHNAFGVNVTHLFNEGDDRKLKFYKRVDTIAFIDVWKEIKGVEVKNEVKDEWYTWVDEDKMNWFRGV